MADCCWQRPTMVVCCLHRRGQGSWQIWGWYHGGRRPSSDDSFHSPTLIPPLALDKPSVMKHYHNWRTMRWGVTTRSPTMVALHDTWFVECRWWNDGWTENCRHLMVVSLHDSGPRWLSPSPSSDHLTGPVVKASALKANIWGSILACKVGIFLDRVIPVTYRLALQWLPYQAPGIIGSALDSVGPVFVCLLVA